MPPVASRLNCMMRSSVSQCRDCRSSKCARRTAEGGRPHIIQTQIPCGAREVHDFHKSEIISCLFASVAFSQRILRKAASDTGFAKTGVEGCTKSGHRLVDGLHSIENTPTYRAWFFVDGKNRRSTTRLFFDSFLSFSGWCGVRGSSGVTFLIERLGRRVSEGL